MKALKYDSVSYAKCGFYWYVESCKFMHASHTWQENNTYLMTIVWDLNMHLIKRQKAFTSQAQWIIWPYIIIIMLCCSHRLWWLSKVKRVAKWHTKMHIVTHCHHAQGGFYKGHENKKKGYNYTGILLLYCHIWGRHLSTVTEKGQR